MILAAGLGTRLRPWTLEHPKALVPVGGVPMLKRVAARLIEQGFDELTVNIHHFGDQVRNFIENDKGLAVRTAVSDETDMLLDTGGALLHAEAMLGKDDRPFLIHNVDIISNADLKGLYSSHEESGRHVSLLVSSRQSDRRLVFDKDMNLKGWVNLKSGERRPASLTINDADRVLSFSGIYVMDPQAFRIMKANGFHGRFPVMDFFLSIIPGFRIGGVVQEGLEILDIGKPDALRRANLKIQ